MQSHTYIVRLVLSQVGDGQSAMSQNALVVSGQTGTGSSASVECMTYCPGGSKGLYARHVLFVSCSLLLQLLGTLDLLQSCRWLVTYV